MYGTKSSQPRYTRRRERSEIQAMVRAVAGALSSDDRESWTCVEGSHQTVHLLVAATAFPAAVVGAWPFV